MLCVDPGKHRCGVARFTRWGVLVSAWLALPDPVTPWDVGEVAIVEVPQVYQRGKGDPGDLVAIAFAGGRVTALFHNVKKVTPAQWKGQTPKAIHHARVRAALDPTEEKIVEAIDCPASLRHNVLDAIAMGLHEFGRI